MSALPQLVPVTRLEVARAALVGPGRADLTGLGRGAAAYLLARASAGSSAPFVVVVRDLDEARAFAADVRFFLGEVDDEEDEGKDVLVFPSSDITPYLDVASDRRAAMDRLGCLAHLALGLPLRCLVVPAAALARKVPPREVLRDRSSRLVPLAHLPRESLLASLEACGYVRTPVVEDPGTYAVRGALVDVYPPHAREPVRIELDEDHVTSLRTFEPSDQKTRDEVEEVVLHPVREAVLGPVETALARERVRALCDRMDMPSTSARALLDELETGRLHYGLDALLPAFYRSLEPLADHLPADARWVVLDPTACGRALDEERTRAEGDHAARVAARKPTFDVDDSYVSTEAVASGLHERSPALLHRLAFEGGEVEGTLGPLETVSGRTVWLVPSDTHGGLTAELTARRAGRSDDALAPLAERVRGWLDDGLSVRFAARTHVQGERLVSLLSAYDDLALDRTPRDARGHAATHDAGRVSVLVGALADGFALPLAGCVYVTEEEIFGRRTHRRAGSKASRKKAHEVLTDLRELAVGDLVVHADHGVGRYLGIERKVLGQSSSERFRGEGAIALEVLVIEYGGGDRLFLPVSRLGLVQKHAGPEGAKPKLDRLGGSTFSKSKKSVAAHVKKMAEELLKLYAERRAARRPALSALDRSYAEFEATFPFEETPDQARAIEDVLDDLATDRPMDRLVCGDVGFGKTEVAIRAAFRVAMAGRQVAVLCPTTVLAQQHFQTFASRFADFPIVVRSLSRFVSKEEQAATLAGLKDGTVDVVVGTHRVLSKDVHFKQLGLLVVDEEQRFGVAHKERIKKLRAQVDVLTLSATPIPRTLQLAIGGLRDLSLITTAPVDRRAVRTIACRWDDHLVKDAIDRELARGGQAFFVYNRIEGLYERAQRLQELVPHARVLVAHGQMREDQLEQAMLDVVEGRADVLCSTTIIESGIDIPRANTILIDRADTYGLAQLYQLRGRVGRARERAFCYLITPPPSQLTDEARARIEALERFTELGSGFRVASLDMELRGAGDLLGAEQSGSVSLVGFDMFCRMLEEAVAELEGHPMEPVIDPEISLDLDHYLPDDYVDDVGLRLSLYKRLALADDDAAIDAIAEEMEDRFGRPPEPARQYVRSIRLRPQLRAMRIVGLEATKARVTLHLRPDTPLDPAKVMALVTLPKSPWKLSPDMKLTRTFDATRDGDAVDRAHELLAALRPLVFSPPA